MLSLIPHSIYMQIFPLSFPCDPVLRVKRRRETLPREVSNVNFVFLKEKVIWLTVFWRLSLGMGRLMLVICWVLLFVRRYMTNNAPKRLYSSDPGVCRIQACCRPTQP